MTTIERLMLDAFRTPPEPDPPLGATDSLRVFRASKRYLTYRRLAWGLRQAAAVGAIVAYFLLDWLVGIPIIAERVFGDTPGAIGFLTAGGFWAVIGALEILALFFLLLQIPVTFFLTQLDYHYRWYMTTDRSLRIREGIVQVREQTMMLANVQNVAIRQGPLQRWLGISDVEVRSAGGGGKQAGPEHKAAGPDLHLCYFRGVSNPEEIRDLILTRLRLLRDAGLGDPDDRATVTEKSGAVAAGRSLLDEAVALRRCVSDSR